MTRKSANGLNTAITVWLNTRGHRGWRNNTVGIYDPATKRYRKNKNTERGVGDIIGITKSGTHFEIETKIGRDTMSIFQVAHRAEVRKRNGIFLMVGSFDDFLVQAEREGL